MFNPGGKKTISLLLTLVFCFSIFSTTVFAGVEPESTRPDAVAQPIDLSLPQPEAIIEELGNTGDSEGPDEITPMALDTIFDLGMLLVDALEFATDPTWEGFGWVLYDVVTVALPGVLNLKGGSQLVGRLINRSSYLKAALQKEVKSYGQLTSATPPSLAAPGGSWQRHHIIADRKSVV
jgi:hypothetical protein